MFLARDLRATGSTFDSNEVIEARWFSRVEILELLKRNGIVDSLSLSPLLFLMLDRVEP